MKRARTAGFSLMEALMALAIAAAVLGGVLMMQHQMVDSQRRSDTQLRNANLQRNALALVKDINPAETPEGEISLPPNITVRWTSEAIGDSKLTTGFPVDDGNFTATLYALTVSVQDDGGRDVIPAFKVERVGWTSATVTAD